MEKQSDRIQKAYDEWAEVYDKNDNPTRDLSCKAIREEALDLTGKEVLVDAFDHSISEFINTGIKAGFNLLGIEEWKSKGEDIPRLLTLRFRKSGV